MTARSHPNSLTARRPVSPPRLSEAERRARHLLRSRGMFSLAFARWNHPRDESLVVPLVRTKCPNLHIAEIRLSKKDPADPVRSLLKKLDGAPPPDAAFIYGLERAFPDFLSYQDDDRPPVLSALNIQRDTFAKRLPIPIVFWLPDHALALLARGAPDFWSFRSGIFELDLPVTDRMRLLRVPPKDLAPAGPVEHGKVRKRLRELLGLWQDFSCRGDLLPTDRRILADIAEELAYLYPRVPDFGAAEKWTDISIERLRRLRRLPRGKAALALREGLLWAKKRTGERAQSLKKAIACYNQALKVYTRRDFPVQWAMTQNSLGIAYSDLPRGDRGQNLKKAIACYRQALKVFSRGDFPVQWAMTQNHLGAAYSDLPTGDRAQNLKKAIACYRAALKIYTENAFPYDHKMVSSNLARAKRELESL